MSAIGPGDWVECVDVSPDWWGYPVPLSLGKIYRVRGVQGSDSGRLAPPVVEAAMGLLLDGVFDGPDGENSFRASRFRPIYRPSAEIILSLLQPAPSEREPELA